MHIYIHNHWLNITEITFSKVGSQNSPNSLKTLKNTNTFNLKFLHQISTNSHDSCCIQPQSSSCTSVWIVWKERKAASWLFPNLIIHGKSELWTLEDMAIDLKLVIQLLEVSSAPVWRNRVRRTHIRFCHFQVPSKFVRHDSFNDYVRVVELAT